jgi:hypothetical protein
MAQCEQCGAEIGEGTLCAACASPSPPKWRGRRVVIAFLVIVVALALLFLGTVLYFVRHTTIVTSSPTSARVEAPFGVVTSNNNPAQLAKTLGIDVFPKAVGVKSTQAELATETMASMIFRTPAPPRYVMHFYHVRFPDAALKLNRGGGTLVQFSGRDTITIKAIPVKGVTQIEINDIRH